MALQISHLVIIGDSFSYCQGLDDPKMQGWPTLLANLLNVPVVNLSSCGSGNDRIHRRLIEYHNMDIRSFPFYIIGYSHSLRREEYIKKFQAYDIIDFEDDSPLSKELVTNHDFKVGAAKKLIIQSSILDFFKKNNLPYVTTDHIPELHEDLAMIKRKNPSLYSYVHNDPNKLIDFGKLVKDLSPLPCGHYGYKAQFIIAEYTFREIIKRYPDINVIQHPFVTLQEYHNMFPYTGPKHMNNDWL